MINDKNEVVQKAAAKIPRHPVGDGRLDVPAGRLNPCIRGPQPVAAGTAAYGMLSAAMNRRDRVRLTAAAKIPRITKIPKNELEMETRVLPQAAARVMMLPSVAASRNRL